MGSTTYFIDEIALVFEGVITGLSSIISDFNSYFMWALLFFGVFLVLFLVKTMMNVFRGANG